MSLPPAVSQQACAGAAAPAAGASTDEIIAALLAEIAAQREVIAALTARVADLERQLGLNSSNSGKPPSSDGPKKPPPRTQSLRDKSGKKTGGQKGHPGKTLCRSEEPHAMIDHFPEVCSGCGGALVQAEDVGFAARQVFDLPKPQPLIVTEHRAHACVCARCGEQTKAALVQFQKGGDGAPTPSCYPMTGWRRMESGRPATSIRFSTTTPMAASACWAARPHARSRGPISAL